MNLLSLLLFFVDKKRAKQNAALQKPVRRTARSAPPPRGKKKAPPSEPVRRIPEKTLFVVALLGGSIGAIAGMWLFRHKTRHWYFVYGMPLVLLLQLLITWIAVRGL